MRGAYYGCYPILSMYSTIQLEIVVETEQKVIAVEVDAP